MDNSSEQEFFIRDLPDLERNSVSPYLSAVSLILQRHGRELPLFELMGLSSLCFRFSASRTPEQPKLIAPYERLLFQALGFVRYSVVDPDTQLRKVKENIRNGIPVLCCGMFGGVDWGVLTGYRGDELYGKIAGSCTRAASHYPGLALRLFDLLAEPLAPQKAFLASLRLCVESRAPQQGEADYAAYFGWLTALRQQTVSAEHSRHLLLRLARTRQSAALYLKSRRALFSGASRQLLLDSAKGCARIAMIAADSAKQPRQLNSSLREILTLEKEIEYNFRFLLDSRK